MPFESGLQQCSRFFAFITVYILLKHIIQHYINTFNTISQFVFVCYVKFDSRNKLIIYINKKNDEKRSFNKRIVYGNTCCCCRSDDEAIWSFRL